MNLDSLNCPGAIRLDKPVTAFTKVWLYEPPSKALTSETYSKLSVVLLYPPTTWEAALRESIFTYLIR